MRWLINYVRSLFCKHEWEFIKNVEYYENPSDRMPVRHTLIYRCKKCGYARKINY